MGKISNPVRNHSRKKARSSMYVILMDANTKSYYMNPGEVAFHVYSDISKVDIRVPHSRVVETEIDDYRELNTLLYNAGFLAGYLDGKNYTIQKDAVYWSNRNPNEVAYAQWMLTKNDRYLDMIQREKLVTLCKVSEEQVFFPTVTLENGTTAVLTYTDRKRIPRELFEKYDGWKCVHMSFDVRCVVNGQFVAE